MPDKKDTSKSRGRSTATKSKSLRLRANELLSKAKASGSIKGGTATPGGGLLARIAAVQAAKAAAKGGTSAAVKGATGTNKSPWVNKALEGSLPTKTFKGAIPGAVVADAARAGSPANAKKAMTKKASSMPKKAKKRGATARKRAY